MSPLGWCYGMVRTPPVTQLKSRALSVLTFFLHLCSVQERKLQELELDLETRAKDVKARLAQLDIQVREWGGG